MSASHPSDTPMTTVAVAFNAKIDRLLHDAEHADSGAMMAGMMRDFAAEQRYRAEQRRLLDEANRLDPKHTAPAWNA